MKFSLITPIHRPFDLTELRRSILAQSFTDWEWILATAPGAVAPDFKDPRIRVIQPAPFSSFSGAKRKAAFASAGGDILVEMNHEDILLENCLRELAGAFTGSDAGFVYSNCAIAVEAARSLGNDVGWHHRPFNWHGRTLAEVVGFDLSAASLAFAWYAPGPIRAWRRSAYEAVGGHNPARDIVDDHELMIRTFLNIKMKHIDRPLCLSHGTGRHPAAQPNVNPVAQAQMDQLYHEFAYPLAERESDLRGLSRIDLCGGFGKPPGYISLDQAAGDIICDLNQGIPLPTSSVGVVRAHDAIEHMKNPIVTMTEIHRVLADGGWAMIMVPSTDGRGAFQDPTHVSFWNENSFWYWTRAMQAKYIRNDTAKFQAFRLQTIFPSDEHRQANISYVTAHLRAVKSNSRRPHFQTM